MKIDKEETKIIGSSSFDGFKIIADEQSKRIDWLVKHYLEKISSDGLNWTVLYQDPEDKRYWELEFPQSDEHGGGPPSLVLLSESDAEERYNI